MKALLGLSLFLNLFLGYLLWVKEPQRVMVKRERPIIEARATTPKSVTRVNFEEVKAPEEVRGRTQKGDSEAPEIAAVNDGELQDAGERMEADRMEFLTGKLGLTEDKIARINRAREDFFKASALFWNKNPMRELSFDDRRKMMALEEDLYKKLEQIYGKNNWEQYQKYRERYNEKGYKKQLENGEPFIFMGL